MQPKLTEIAERLGLDLEMVSMTTINSGSFRVYKGAKQVFEGAEDAVRDFFDRYEKNRPGPFVEGMCGYRE